MSCPGLHCPGCSGGQSLGILAGAVIGLVVVAETVQWVAERIFWIGGTLAVCFALSVAASMWLETRADQRGRAWGAARGIYSRADYIAPEPLCAVTATVIPQASQGTQAPAIEQHVHFHFDPGDREAAQFIRTALTGQQPGEAITEEK
jgi:MFS family permease